MPRAWVWLADVLIEQPGDHRACGSAKGAERLADLLAGRGKLDQAEQILRALVDAGHGHAGHLAELLTQQGREEAAERLRRFGVAPEGITCQRMKDDLRRVPPCGLSEVMAHYPWYTLNVAVDDAND